MPYKVPEYYWTLEELKLLLMGHQVAASRTSIMNCILLDLPNSKVKGPRKSSLSWKWSIQIKSEQDQGLQLPCHSLQLSHDHQ
jgi:hypothetical protein